MDANNIQNLVDKYWQGETSLEEEARLKDYFKSNSISEDHLQYKVYFDFLSHEQEIKMQDEVILPSSTYAKPEAKVIRMRPLRRWVGVAATIVIIVGFFWMINLRDDVIKDDTYENPELALEQAKEALYFLSNKMDKGAQSTTDQIRQLEKLSIFN